MFLRSGDGKRNPVRWFFLWLLLCGSAEASIQQIGPNDVLISQAVGAENDPDLDANDPAVAFNSIDQQFIAVWSDNADAAGFEIYARLIGSDGNPLGNQVNVSSLSVSDNLNAFAPSVVFNRIRHEYLVVWFGQDFEIYARRLGPDLALLGAETAVSDVDQLPLRGAVRPRVAFNALDDEYLVVWYADDPAAGLADDEFEIFGQRISGVGNLIGDNDFRISDVAGTGDATRGAVRPDVAFNALTENYLVVWSADDNNGGQVDQEFEIFGQLLDAAGNEVGVNDFRISNMGGVGAVEFDALMPAVAANEHNGQWLVVWYGDDDMQGLIDEEFEIFGDVLSGTGQSLSGGFRVSNMGGTGNTDYQAFRPDVVFNSVTREFVVSWQGDGRTWQGGMPDSDEYEIWAQRVSEMGMLIGNHAVISDMGDNGSEFDARTSALAVDNRGETVVVWNGSDDTEGGAVGEFGVFGQKLAETPVFTDGFE